MEKRQPVLHTRIALARAHGFIERVGAGGWPERLHVAPPEQLLAGVPERDLADRHQRHPLHDAPGALGLGIEGLDLLQGVAEEIEAHRRGAAGRIEVEDAATHGVLAGLHNRAAAREARQVETLDQLLHVEPLTGRDVFERAADELPRRGALQDGIDGGDDDGWLFAACRGEAGERRHAAGHDLAVGADAIVGHRVPGRKLDDPHLGSEEGEALGNGFQPPVVARDVQQQRRSVSLWRRVLGEIAEQQRHQPVRHAGQDFARWLECDRLVHCLPSKGRELVKPCSPLARSWFDTLTTRYSSASEARLGHHCSP